jgi:hypothetical protein
MVRSADVIVYLDDVQFTRRDWRNRNLITSGQGPKWMSIPLNNSGNYFSLIHEMTVSEPDWWKSHLALLENTYRNQENFRKIRTEIQAVFESLQGVESLSEINRRINDWVFSVLGIAVQIHDSREIPSQLKRTERFVEICKLFGASEYVSGPAARAYLDERLFNMNSITVRWVDYSKLPPAHSDDAKTQELSILHHLATEEISKVIRLSSFDSISTN